MGYVHHERLSVTKFWVAIQLIHSINRFYAKTFESFCLKKTKEVGATFVSKIGLFYFFSSYHFCAFEAAGLPKDLSSIENFKWVDPLIVLLNDLFKGFWLKIKHNRCGLFLWYSGKVLPCQASYTGSKVSYSNFMLNAFQRCLPMLCQLNSRQQIKNTYKCIFKQRFVRICV